MIDAIRNSELPESESNYHCYIVTGTLSDVQRKMHALSAAGVR